MKMISLKELMRFEVFHINEEYVGEHVKTSLKNYSEFLLEAEEKNRVIQDFSFFSIKHNGV